MTMITPDRLYDLNDMVKADCGDCKGCFSCCEGMGNSILLDPYDIFLLTKNLNKTMEQLLQKEIELNVVNGLILPNLKMEGIKERCSFLNEEKRCSIHSFRPGICRLFPLGRQYEEGKLKYFLVPGECTKTDRSKVKVKKWLDTQDIKRNQKFLIDWHDFKKALEVMILKENDEQFAKNTNLFLLNQFYRKNYETDDFYTEFEERLRLAKEALGI